MHSFLKLLYFQKFFQTSNFCILHLINRLVIRHNGTNSLTASQDMFSLFPQACIFQTSLFTPDLSFSSFKTKASRPTDCRACFDRPLTLLSSLASMWSSRAPAQWKTNSSSSRKRRFKRTWCHFGCASALAGESERGDILRRVYRTLFVFITTCLALVSGEKRKREKRRSRRQESGGEERGERKSGEGKAAFWDPFTSFPGQCSPVSNNTVGENLKLPHKNYCCQSPTRHKMTQQWQP